jgi:hypothetical protein
VLTPKRLPSIVTCTTSCCQSNCNWWCAVERPPPIVHPRPALPQTRVAAFRKQKREARLNNPTLGKEALRQAAIDRLTRDGASSTAALQRRVLVLAHERNLCPADYFRLMYKKINTRDFVAFCEKHEVSLDWLMFGDMKALQRMTQERRAGKPVFPPGSLQEKLACLTEAERETIRNAIDQVTGDAS